MKVVLFGGGKSAKRIYKKMQKDVVAVIDNNKKRYFEQDIPFITLQEYKNQYMGGGYKILISSALYADEIKQQLQNEGVFNFSESTELYRTAEVCEDDDIKHGNWPQYLKKLCDKPGMKILEVGSRVQTGANFRNLFEKATYCGFDYYAGENVDVVGDAHKLSSYFDEKFDLIFSHAVFEHFAMPWIVSMEMIKLLKINGYVFVETHFAQGIHEQPWHFFHFTENALHVLFPEKFGMRCVKKGLCNLIKGAEFSEYASEYLVGKKVPNLYCHSDFLGQKIKEVPLQTFDWNTVNLEDVAGSTYYPKHDYKG